ncbi:MAG TPA: electron transfer flavoprotein subunit beta/FixA family protein [Firmicutes bacterium]|nr:electron transfer flavoprotein subunit beta/FixA family protein [Bacillota bacterium]
MQVIVCIKQVPASLDVQVDPKTHNLIREGVESVINPFDENAIEAALELKGSHGALVSLLSMGPPQVKEALRKGLAMGADQAYLISDRALGGADTLATSYTLAQAIKKMGSYDLILCGRHAVDADTGQVGPELAERLNLPQITYVSKIEASGNRVRAERLLEETREVVEVPLPALLTVTKELNTPRYATPLGIMKAAKKPLTVWTAADIAAEADKIGLAGSPTRVTDVFAPPGRERGEMLTGKPEEIAAALAERLQAAKIL